MSFRGSSVWETLGLTGANGNNRFPSETDVILPHFTVSIFFV